jgi:DNA-binding NarL/FixJ family response regulator
MRPRIVLAEDHAAVAEQLRLLLSADYEVVDTVADGAALVAAVRAAAPDAVVADIGMESMDGLAAAGAILAEAPGARVVFVSVRDEAALIRHALTLGARAYVWKADAGEELLEAVRATLLGGRYVSAHARTVLGMTDAAGMWRE